VWFSPGTPVSSTNNTDRHDKTEILLKEVLNTIKKTLKYLNWKRIIYGRFLSTFPFGPVVSGKRNNF
jgi:hypothetical protein